MVGNFLHDSFSEISHPLLLHAVGEERKGCVMYLVLLEILRYADTLPWTSARKQNHAAESAKPSSL